MTQTFKLVLLLVWFYFTLNWYINRTPTCSVTGVVLLYT